MKLVLGCAQDLRIARESWDGAYDLAVGVDELKREFVINPRTRPGRRDGAGYESIVLHPICEHGDPVNLCTQCPPGDEHGLPEREYRVSAATKSAGRGLTVDLLIMDEFRHCTSLAWAALSKTTTAVESAITLPISNAGTDESEVLNTIRESALAGDEESIGIMEWSAEDGCALDDPDGNCHANPALSYKITERTLRGFRKTDSAEVYRTESLCQRQVALDVVFAPDAWKACEDLGLNLATLRPRVTCVFEVAPDGAHATLMSAGKFTSGKIGLDVVAAWTDLRKVPAELPKLIAKIKPAVFGWFPDGPAKEFGTLLRGLRNSREIKGAMVSEACQTLVGLVARHAVLHADDPLLTTQTLGTRKLEVADGYRFVRKGVGHVDATYAAAGAALLAESLTVPKTSGVWVV